MAEIQIIVEEVFKLIFEIYPTVKNINLFNLKMNELRF